MQIIGKLCALLNTKEPQVVLDTLKSNFGKMVITGKARVYHTEDAKKKTEHPYLQLAVCPNPKRKELHNHGCSEESSRKGADTQQVFQG